MNKANECTCPSGDGSLVHPCPAHPAVEQVGGDERAAFELFVRKHCGMPAHIAVNWDAKFTNDAWEGWKARAALAQPSPTQAEQTEVEVVARVMHSNPVVLDHCGPLNANDELMTVAQHAASVARWAEMFNRVEQERDAALSRVAELEKQEPVAHLRASDLERLNQPGIAGSAGSLWNGPREGFVPLYAAPVAQAQQLHDLDKQCRDDVARALGLRPSQDRGFAWSYLLASIKSCAKAPEDAAQAQHSVPEGVDAGAG
ncbi:hypothetical protein ACM73F_14675 [Pseudomonas aeruginosa]